MAATGLTVVHPVAGWQKTANTTAGEGPKPFQPEHKSRTSHEAQVSWSTGQPPDSDQGKFKVWRAARSHGGLPSSTKAVAGKRTIMPSRHGDQTRVVGIRSQALRADTEPNYGQIGTRMHSDVVAVTIIQLNDVANHANFFPVLRDICHLNHFARTILRSWSKNQKSWPWPGQKQWYPRPHWSHPRCLETAQILLSETGQTHCHCPPKWPLETLGTGACLTNSLTELPTIGNWIPSRFHDECKTNNLQLS